MKTLSVKTGDSEIRFSDKALFRVFAKAVLGGPFVGKSEGSVNVAVGREIVRCLKRILKMLGASPKKRPLVKINIRKRGVAHTVKSLSRRGTLLLGEYDMDSKEIYIYIFSPGAISRWSLKKTLVHELTHFVLDGYCRWSRNLDDEVQEAICEHSNKII